jgi:signal peptidase II
MSLLTRESSPNKLLSSEQQWRWDLIIGAIALGVIVLDQATKQLIVNHFHVVFNHISPCPVDYPMNYGDYIPVIGNILTFQYTCNTGTAFSFAEGSPIVYFFLLVAFGVIGWFYWVTRAQNNIWLKITFGATIGGALGNIVDRIRYGSVVDFIHFQLPALNFNFAVFNVSDSFISVGMISLALIFWLNSPQNADSNPKLKPTFFSPETANTPSSTVDSSSPKKDITTSHLAEKDLPTPPIKKQAAIERPSSSTIVRTSNRSRPKKR